MEVEVRSAVDQNADVERLGYGELGVRAEERRDEPMVEDRRNDSVVNARWTCSPSEAKTSSAKKRYSDSGTCLRRPRSQPTRRLRDR